MLDPPPTVTVYREAEHASYVELPIISRRVDATWGAIRHWKRGLPVQAAPSALPTCILQFHVSVDLHIVLCYTERRQASTCPKTALHLCCHCALNQRQSYQWTSAKDARWFVAAHTLAEAVRAPYYHLLI